MNDNATKRWDDACPPTSTVNMLAGMWLIVSPWVLGFASRSIPFWDTLLGGVAVAVLTAMRLKRPQTVGFSWIITKERSDA